MYKLPGIMPIHWRAAFVLFFVLTNFGAIAATGPNDTEEDQLIAVLQSNASLQKKDAACARLKIIGSDRCLPALKPLLLDQDLSHSARYAVEPMSSEKAEQALLDALEKAQGPIRLGIISSLGVRHDQQAVSPLARLLKDPDPATTRAAYTALGQIGGAAALKPLMQSLHDRQGAKEKMPRELADGILRCAHGLLASGKDAAALA